MRLMNFTNPNGDSEDGELYEPHESREADGEPRLLTSKEKIQELQQLLEEKQLEQMEMKILL